MEIKNIIDNATLQHEIHLRNIFNSFVGRSFKSIKELRSELIKATNEDIVLIDSEFSNDFQIDFQIDGEIGKENPFTLWYLIPENTTLLTITEIQF